VRRTRFAALVTGLAAAAAIGVAAPASAAPPRDPHEIWPQDVSAQIATAPCDRAGPSAEDAALATRLNPLLRNKMRGYLTPYRMSCARVVVKAVRDRGLNPRAAAIAMSTIIVETGMMNYSEAVDHDSLGLFQQRPSQGWCAPAQCIDPVFATTRFLDAMMRFYPNGSWNTAPIGDVAADVQRPAAQYRYRYGVEAADSVVLADALWAGGALPHPYGSGRVVSAKGADGRLETFAAAADGVHHAFQTSVNGPWSAWRFLGGPRSAQLAIAPNRDGRLELFALSGSTFEHRWQTAPNGNWSAWTNFGAGGHQLAAGTNVDGRVEVFASNPNGVFHRWQTTPGSWSGWTGVGGPATSRLALERSADGRLELFALSATTFGHRWQTGPSSWSGWSTFGDGGHDLAAGHNTDGRVEVFASNPDGVFHRWQTTPGAWSPWTALGGPARAELTAVRSVDGRIELFAINGSTARHTWQRGQNTPFAGWTDFGGGGTEIGSSTNADGRIEVFGTNPTGVYHRWQTGLNAWNPTWGPLAGSPGPPMP
jgi:hypothetical protein